MTWIDEARDAAAGDAPSGTTIGERAAKEGPMTDSDRAQWRARVHVCVESWCHRCRGPARLAWDDARLDAVLAEMVGNHPAIPESSPATDHAALAAFGAKVLGTFSEYWGDVDGSDLQEWAIETGCLVGHAKQPLPYGAPPVGAYTGVCNGQLCTGETEPGDVCYHRPPAIAATVARLTGGPDA